MKLDRMHTWSPRRGALGEVRPTAAAVARLQEAPVSPGPASFLQGDHLRAFAAGREAGRQHRAYTGTAATVDLPLDRRALTRAFERLICAHESLRSWFDLDGPEPICHVGGVEGVAAEYIEHEPIDGPWPQHLHAYMERELDRTCRPDQWAPFYLGVIDHSDETFSLWWGCDHAFTDGASQIMVLVDLVDLYRDELHQPTTRPLVEASTVGSFREYSAAEQQRAAQTTADDPRIQAWITAVKQHDGRLPSSPLRLDLAPGQSAAAMPGSYPLVDSAVLTELEDRVRGQGSSVQAAFYAGLAVATCDLSGADDYYGATVLATRDREHARTFGWLCNFAPVVFAVDPQRRSQHLLAAATEAISAAKETATVPVHSALAAMMQQGLTTPERLGSPQMVSYLDMRRFPGAGERMYEDAVHFIGEGRTANTSLWVQRESQRLYVSILAPHLPGVQDRCARFAAGISQVLHQLAAGESVLSSGLDAYRAELAAPVP